MTTTPGPYQPLTHDGPRHPFIVLEGVSGIGKSTLARALAMQLGASSLHTLPRPHADWSKTANSGLRPLPQFAFYLSGALHASDRIRECRAIGPVVADRYISSVIACHAAVHRVSVETVQGLLAPFHPYLVAPDLTFYLRCSQATLRARLATKTDLKQDDTDLLTVPDRLARLVANFDRVAGTDPSAVVLDTDDRSPDDLARAIRAHIEESQAC
ncbi:thymidylate kinase [Streptomyces sp. DH12]|uniref:dTMP kinase n=1 Tax=Streptomyces sp. DH12 TaxID=2857010 RepID=UPI001E4A4C2A|nr:thymidylate kinase [Streptomyces sp. DH12]